MKRTRILTVALVLAVLSVGWIAQNRLLASREGEWVEVVRRDLVLGIEATGTLEALDSDMLGPPSLSNRWDFKISMMAPEGSEVKKGQPVLGFDASELQRQLEEKIDERDAARKQIEKARADLAIRKEEEELALAKAEATKRKSSLKLDAPEELQSSNERKQIELEETLAGREIEHRRGRLRSFQIAAQREIAMFSEKEARADNDVRNMQSQVEKMTVRAPRDGTVVYITNWRNEKKKVGDSTWRQEKVLEIPDLTEMMAKGEVDEADAGKVTLGQAVALRLDAHPDDELHGKVTSIAKTVQRQNPRTPMKILKIDISLDQSDPGKMRPGMRFRGRLETGRAKQTILIPEEAVFSTAEGPVAVRRTVTGRETIPLTLGRRNDEQVEVLSGLEPGDRVLLRKATADEKEGESS